MSSHVQFYGVCWIRRSVIGVNILDQSPVSRSLVCLFTVGILYEESRDGKREMAADFTASDAYLYFFLV